MKNKKMRRRALLTSIMSLILCCAMLVGTTFAWFTDSVTSASNIIKSGNLDVSLEWMKGTEDPSDKDSSAWMDASTGAIFNYTLWEPGYTEVRHIKIENEGTLALKYKVEIIPNGTVDDLSDVIDVYYIDPAQQMADRAELPEASKMGTLTNVLSGLSSSAYGTLKAGENVTITLALKMQESAGNDYQNKSIGSEFAVQVFATQYTYEEDSFDETYDETAEYPIAPVYPVSTTAELLDRLEDAVPGDNIFLNPGEYEISAPLSIPSGVSLYGVQAGNPAADWANDPDARKTILKATGSGNVIEIIQTSADVNNAVSNITLNGLLIDCNNTAAKGVYVRKSDGEAMEGIRIANCAVLNSTDDGLDVQNAYGAVIENNYISNVKDCAIRLGNYNGYHYKTWAEVTACVRNNVIENVTASGNGAIMLENGMGDVVVCGNTIKNVVAEGALGSGITKASAITVYDVYEGGIITVEDNTIENADQGIAVYKYTYGTCYGEDWWEGPTSDNDGVTIRNNTIKEFKNFGIITTHLSQESTANTSTVTITGNDIVSTVTANALVVEEFNSNWTVTASGNTLNGEEASAVNGTTAK